MTRRHPWLILALPFFACARHLPAQGTENKPVFVASAEFNVYWNSGLAELSRYELTQARYGNLQRGEMIVITVTEPFRTDKQVKSEINPGVHDTPVLKAQVMRRFATGIYDYAITTTSFKPLDVLQYPLALKVTGSAVDWCGHTWLQLNLKKSNYHVQSRSYFEEFGDEDFTIPGSVSEDEVWQQIRLHPQSLPTGNFNVIPSLASSRLRHRRLMPEMAAVTLKDLAVSKRKEYSLLYAAGSADERQVFFIFEKDFPYRILEYRETYRDGFQNPKKLTSIARLKKSIRSAYWREHDPQHHNKRIEFGVKGFE